MDFILAQHRARGRTMRRLVPSRVFEGSLPPAPLFSKAPRKSSRWTRWGLGVMMLAALLPFRPHSGNVGKTSVTLVSAVADPVEAELSERLRRIQAKIERESEEKLEDPMDDTLIGSALNELRGDIEKTAKGIEAKVAAYEALSGIQKLLGGRGLPQEIEGLHERHEVLVEAEERLEMRYLRPSFVQARNRLRPDRVEPGWPENTLVLAGNLQGQSSYRLSYLSKMIGDLKSAGSVWEAHRRSERRGFVNISNGYAVAHAPVASVKGPRDQWRRETRVPRRVLIIQGEALSDNDEPFFSEKTGRLKSVLMAHYGVPEDQVKTLKAPKLESVRAALEEMAAFAKANPGAEAMVVYAGHGAMQQSLGRGVKEADGEKEGAQRGGIMICWDEVKKMPFYLYEEEMKGYFNTYLQGYGSVILMLDTCKAGAWIASATQPQPGELPG